jgi:hypothetical protein
MPLQMQDSIESTQAWTLRYQEATWDKVSLLRGLNSRQRLFVSLPKAFPDRKCGGSQLECVEHLSAVWGCEGFCMACRTPHGIHLNRGGRFCVVLTGAF